MKKLLIVTYVVCFAQISFCQENGYYNDFKSAFQNPDSVIGLSINCMHMNELQSDACDSLPEKIYLLKNLKDLYTSETHIKTLPWSINKLKRLKYITINYNYSFNYETELCKLIGLDSLEYLGLWMNSFKILPNCISNLKTLKGIDLSFNNNLNLKKCIKLLAELPNLESLNISGLKMRTLPKNIINLKNLTDINIGYAKAINYKPIFKILAELNVKRLNIENSGLSELPDNISFLTKLKYIDLTENWFDSIPTEIISINTIEEIECSHNHSFKLVQQDIVKLKNLRTLNIAHNIEMDGYNSIKHLSKLDNLESLDLFGCFISDVPDELSDFKKLRFLNLERNGKLDFQKLFILLSKVTTLESLDIADNKIDKLPSEIGLLSHLTYLNIGENDFTELPTEIYQLKKLKTLNIFRAKLSKELISELKAKLPECNIIQQPVFRTK